MGESDPVNNPTDHRGRQIWWLGGPTLLVVLGMAGLLGWHSLTDLDIWFHLRAGRDLLAGGGFPQVNTYSFTDPNHAWLNHEWLFQLLAVWTAPVDPLAQDLATGWNSLRLGLIMSLTVVLLLGDGNVRRLRTTTSVAAPALVSLVVFAGLLLLWPRFNLRPELISYLFFVLLVRAADSHYRRPAPANLWRDKSLWRLGALVLVWAQCHGFAALGPLILLLRVIVRPLDRDADDHGTALPTWPVGPLLAPIALTVLALVLTPNHWRGVLFPLRALGQFSASGADLNQTVSELVPLLQTPNALGLTLTAFQFSVFWGALFAVLGWRRIGVLRIVLFGATAAAAVASQRNIALYGLAFILLHTGLQGQWPSPWWRRKLRLNRLPGLPPLALGMLATVLIIAGAAWWAPRVVTNDFYLGEGVGRRFGSGSTPTSYPRQASANLTAPGAQRTFANLDAAAFLLGTSEARLFIDGRTEAYPASRWAEYAQVRRGGPTAAAIFEREQVSAVVLALSSGGFTPLANDLMASPAWHPVAADAGGVLFLPGAAQAHFPAASPLRQAARRLLATPHPDPTRWADLCQAAADLQQLAGHPEGARQALTTGLAARPDHPNLNHNMGNLLLAEGRFTQALAHFQAALTVNGRLAGSALNAGVCQLRLQRPESAVTSFRRSLAIDSDQVGGWVNLAVALRRTGEAEAAMAALKKALVLQPGNARLQNQLRQWQNGR